MTIGDGIAVAAMSVSFFAFLAFFAWLAITK